MLSNPSAVAQLENGLCLHAAHADFQSRWRGQSEPGWCGGEGTGRGDLRSSLFLLAAVFPFSPLLSPCTQTVGHRDATPPAQPRKAAFPLVCDTFTSMQFSVMLDS